MKTINAVFAEKKAALEQMLTTIESLKGTVEEAQKAIEQMKRYGNQRNMDARIAEKTGEILKAEAELAQLSGKAEALKQDVRAARDAAKEKREQFRLADSQLLEFIEHNKL